MPYYTCGKARRCRVLSCSGAHHAWTFSMRQRIRRNSNGNFLPEQHEQCTHQCQGIKTMGHGPAILRVLPALASPCILSSLWAYALKGHRICTLQSLIQGILPCRGSSPLIHVSAGTCTIWQGAHQQPMPTSVAPDAGHLQNEPQT